MLKIQVLPDGNVGDVYVESGPGYPILEEAAMSAAKNWTFLPALEEGEPVSSIKRVRIPFTLRPR